MVNWMRLWRFKEKPSGLSLFYKRLFYGALFLCERLHPPIQLLLRGFRGAGGTDVDFIPGESGGQSAFCPSLPIARDNWSSGTTTRQLLPSGKGSTLISCPWPSARRDRTPV